MKRSELRSKILGAKVSVPPQPMEIEVNGEKLRLFTKVPSVAERDTILKRSGIKADGEGGVTIGDPSSLQAHAIIVCAVDEDGHSIFEEADYDALRALPSIGFFEELAKSCMDIFQKKAKETGKT